MSLSSLIQRFRITDGTDTADVTAASALKVDGSAVTQPVSDAGGSLTVDGPLTDAQMRATAVPVSLAGGADQTQGSVSDAVWSGSGNGTAIAIHKAVWTRLRGGQQAMADSLPVVVASNQSVIPVSDNSSSLTVDGTVSVTGVSTLAEQQTQTTALQLLDNLVLAEDAASASGDPGLAVLAVRKGTPANTSGTDGDYEPLQVSAGRLWASATIDAAIPAGTNNIGDVDLASAIPAGTNNIGDVDVLTLPAIPAGNNNIGDVDVASIAAGTNVIGRVAGMEATGTIYNGTTATTPAYAAIDAATSGDNTLVAAAGASNKIRVYALFLVAAGTVTARFESGAGGTALSGQMNLIANTGFVLPYNPLGWFETAANTLLNLELSAAVSVDGSLTYSVVQ
jgi:hypothetical protein